MATIRDGISLYRPLSAAAQNMLKLVKAFTQRDLKVPYDGIQSVDSRWWDPNWEYRGRYNTLSTIITWAFGGDSDRALTVASGQSFYWGKGDEPTRKLRQMDRYEPTEVVTRLGEAWQLITRLSSGVQSIWDGIISNAINTTRRTPEEVFRDIAARTIQVAARYRASVRSRIARPVQRAFVDLT